MKTGRTHMMMPMTMATARITEEMTIKGTL